MRNPFIRLPRLMTNDLQEIARLNPVKESVTMKMQPLSTADIELSPDDPKVTVGMFVELYDLNGSLGVFRVAKVKSSYGAKDTQTISLEHGIVTLADALLSGYWELGGPSVESEEETSYVPGSTNDVIDTLLSLQPEGQVYWVRDDSIPPEHTVNAAFTYSWENENVLTALASLTEPMVEQVMWTFDFSEFPWKVGLMRLDVLETKVASCELRMNRNMSTATVDIDMQNLVTRIYPLGSGEGDDQVTIVGVLVNGQPYTKRYIENEEAVAKWGIINGVYSDPSITDSVTLYNTALRVLDTKKTPTVTVTVSALELFKQTGEPWDRLMLGRVCRVSVPDQGVVLEERIIEMNYADMYNRPRDIKLTLANKTQSTEDAIANLQRKINIAELSSQGTASEYGMSFNRTCSPNAHAILRFYVDEDDVHVNKVLVRFEATDGASVAAYADDLPTPIPVSGNQFDAVGYLLKDENTGKIKRRTWHHIALVPNKNCTIDANLHIRTFIRSSVTG